MAGKNYLSPAEILRDISDNIINIEDVFFSELYNHIPQLFLNEYIIKQSVIDIPEYYKSCVILSYKTANSQHDIDNMPYWVFNNFIAFLNEILEEEGKGQNDGSSANDQYQQMMNQSKQMMNQFKGSTSIPKFKK